MIVITADQIASRSTDDAVRSTIDQLNQQFADSLTLAAERTVGDEIQLITKSGATAVSIALHLTRTRRWSVGIGVGAVRLPLGDSIRESSGPAFFAAREAVERAKRKRQSRFALDSNPATGLAEELEALVDLLLLVRKNRSDKAWRLYDLLESGMTQSDAANQLGVSAQSASKMALTWSFRAEEAARQAASQQLGRISA